MIGMLFHNDYLEDARVTRVADALAVKDIPNIHLRILVDGNRLHHVLSFANELSINDRLSTSKGYRLTLLRILWLKLTWVFPRIMMEYLIFFIFQIRL